MSSSESTLVKPHDLLGDKTKPTTALLSFDTVPNSSSSSSSRTSKTIFVSVVLLTCVALAAAAAAVVFAFLVQSSPAPAHIFSHSLQTLRRPTVILISCDGFRFGYQHKTHLPNIQRLITGGTEAELGLIPVFPTLTFPNHYSIATGLYPAHHGIVNNHFFDPVAGDEFTMASHDPKWWLGEPLWTTAVRSGLRAATYFWPGSEVKKGSWDCPESLCFPYNESVPFVGRVNTVLSFFDDPSDDSEPPSFVTLYFEDPDHQGHRVGPDDPEIDSALRRLDSVIGRLITGLEERRVFKDVNLILVGDHGMVGNCDKKLVFLDDLNPRVKLDPSWVQYTSPILAIRPGLGVDPAELVKEMNSALQSGRVKNGKRVKVYLKEDLPARLHYSGSDRIAPIVGIVEEGFKVEMKRNEGKECGGDHGYDNKVFSMRTIFVGHGPRFSAGRKVPSFENVEIYGLVTEILGIDGAPNNGSRGFPDSVLLPPSPS